MTLSVAVMGPPGVGPATIVEEFEATEAVDGGNEKSVDAEVFWVESEDREGCELVEFVESWWLG